MDKAKENDHMDGKDIFVRHKINDKMSSLNMLSWYDSTGWEDFEFRP